MKLAHIGEPVFLVHQEWKKISEYHIRILKIKRKKKTPTSTINHHLGFYQPSPRVFSLSLEILNRFCDLSTILSHDFQILKETTRFHHLKISQPLGGAHSQAGFRFVLTLLVLIKLVVPTAQHHRGHYHWCGGTIEYHRMLSHMYTYMNISYIYMWCIYIYIYIHITYYLYIPPYFNFPFHQGTRPVTTFRFKSCCCNSSAGRCNCRAAACNASTSVRWSSSKGSKMMTRNHFFRHQPNQQANHPTNQPTNHPTNQPTNQASKQSTNQSSSQATHMQCNL